MVESLKRTVAWHSRDFEDEDDDEDENDH